MTFDRDRELAWLEQRERERPTRYVLDDNGKPRPEPNLLAWARWFESHERHVGQTIVRGVCRVSTVFLGIDHAWFGGPPVLWETMAFGGPWKYEPQWRYSSREAAIIGHARMVRFARRKLRRAARMKIKRRRGWV